MDLETIGDFEDPRLADYRNLKDATLATRRGRFIVEGRGVLRVLLTRSAYRPESILLNRRSFEALEADLERAAPGCPIYVAPQPVLDRVVGFPIHRGCLAACSRSANRGEAEADDPIALAERVRRRFEAPRILVLEGLANLDNVGLVFRNAMALGGRAVLLCPRCCDPLYRKAIRTSMGGTLCVPFARTRNLPELLAGLRASGFEILALDPGAESVSLSSLDAGALGPTALLLGTEGAGLSREALAGADRRVRIEMEPGVDSLNVGVAAGIALSRLRVEGRSSIGFAGGAAGAGMEGGRQA
ncbi:MAG TPA: RNA methyltransferase [Deltaproteobacteria bacterium]|nr:RNA methyltransferase [Deltaproteobacteria bacterium]